MMTKPNLVKYCKIEIIVIVRDNDFALTVDANTNGIVGNTLPTNLTQILAFVTENLNAVSSIIANKDFIVGCCAYSIWKFKISGAAELLQNISIGIKDNNTHNLKKVQ